MVDREIRVSEFAHPPVLRDGVTCTDQTTKHIVMWNVQGNEELDRVGAAALVKSLFEGLVGKVPGLLRVEVGVDLSRVDYACDVVLVSEFEDGEALAAYAGDPEHLAVRDRLMGIRTARHQVDYHSPRWTSRHI